MQFLDRLEDRTLLSFIGFRDSGILSIEATTGDDVIVIGAAPDPTLIRIQINSDAPVDIPITSRKPSHNVQIVSVSGLDGDDVIHYNGPIPHAILRGDAGNDLIESVAGDLEALGGDGNDTVLSSGNDSVSFEGGSGRDTFTSTGAAPVFATGGSGNDLITTTTGNDSVWGGPGSDTISTGAGDDVILGGRGDDLIDAGDGDDWLFGQQGNDTLTGGDGADHLFGQDGNDSLAGQAGNDTFFTGPGAADTTDATGTEFVHHKDYQRFERLFAQLLGSFRPT